MNNGEIEVFDKEDLKQEVPKNNNHVENLKEKKKSSKLLKIVAIIIILSGICFFIKFYHDVKNTNIIEPDYIKSSH